MTPTQTRFQAHASAPPMPGRVGMSSGRQFAAPKTTLADGSFSTSPLLNGDWSLSFVAFLAYTFAIVTLKAPIGTASMLIALLTLPLEGRPLRFPPVMALTCCMVGWAALGAMMTNYPDKVIDNITEFAKITVVLFVGLNVLSSRSRIRIYLLFFTVCWGLYPIRGTLYDHFIAHADVQGRSFWRGVYENPNDLAGLSLLALGVALGMVAGERKPWVQWGARLATGCLLLIVLLTQSRGAMIAIVTFAAVYGYKYLRNTRAILTAVVVAGIVLALAPDSMWRRFATLKNAADTSEELYDSDYVDDLATRQDQASSAQRLAIWNVAIHMVAENPIVGVGIGAYPEVHFRMVRPGVFNRLARGRRDTHSTYLNVAAETGVPGLLIFLSLVGSVIVQARRARQKYKARAPALAFQLFNVELGLWAYLVAGIWGSYGFFLYTYVHLMLLSAMTHILTEENEAVLVRGRVSQGQRSGALQPQLARVRS